LKKNDAYKLLADYVNARFHKKWDWKVVSTRYRSVFKKYTATKRAFMDVSGKKFGLTVEEVARGVTIDQKLDSMCHGYRRWDALFGTRQNVNPSYSLESVDSDDEEEENDGNEENDSFDDEISNLQHPSTDLQLDFLTEPRSAFSSLAPSPVSAPSAASGSGSFAPLV
jgi:hypothetical protein